MNKRIFYTSIILIVIAGCRGPKLSTVWKNPTLTPPVYHKVMVVAIAPNESDSLRRTIELQLVADLDKLGYYAVSSLEEFGKNGLAPLGEEATYLKLCDNGIDGVLTIARSDEPEELKAGDKRYTSLHYYQRILSYKQLLTDSTVSSANYQWESILFDVVTLSPQIVLQKNGRSNMALETEALDFARQTMQRLRKEKLVPRKRAELKAF